MAIYVMPGSEAGELSVFDREGKALLFTLPYETADADTIALLVGAGCVEQPPGMPAAPPPPELPAKSSKREPQEGGDA